MASVLPGAMTIEDMAKADRPLSQGLIRVFWPDRRRASCGAAVWQFLPVGNVWKTTAGVCMAVALAGAAIYSPRPMRQSALGSGQARDGLLNRSMQNLMDRRVLSRLRMIPKSRGDRTEQFVRQQDDCMRP